MPIKKKAKKAVKTVKRNTVSNSAVHVGRFGSDPVGILVDGSTTVGRVLRLANIDLGSNENAWLNGARASLTTKVKGGDIISIVSPKKAGYRD